MTSILADLAVFIGGNPTVWWLVAFTGILVILNGPMFAVNDLLLVMIGVTLYLYSTTWTAELPPTVFLNLLELVILFGVMAALRIVGGITVDLVGGVTGSVRQTSGWMQRVVNTVVASWASARHRLGQHPPPQNEDDDPELEDYLYDHGRDLDDL